MKDYYKLLEVAPGATEEQIRKAYRRLALKYHPDRNPGDPQAEERFKEIAEAYGVLMDPAKRARYDAWQRSGSRQGPGPGAGEFRYSREEILKDLFQNPRFRQSFEELFKEFEKSGMRFDQHFFNQVFFGGRGLFFGGAFFWSPFGANRTHGLHLGQRTSLEKTRPQQSKRPALLKKIGQKIGGFLHSGPGGLPQKTAAAPAGDLIYHLTVSRQEADQGTWINIVTMPGVRPEKLKVRVPPGTRPESRLRLKGRGKYSGRGRGDLYIIVHIKAA